MSRSRKDQGVITWRQPAETMGVEPAVSAGGVEPPEGVATWRRGGLGTFPRCGRGQSLVEFALLIPLVLLLFLGIFEISSYFYTRMTLRHSVMEASRFAITGAQVEDESSGEPMTRAASIAEVYRRAAPTVAVDLERLTIDPADGGQPGDIVTISATYSYDFTLPMVDQFFPDGLEFTVKTAMRNEPSFQE